MVISDSLFNLILEALRALHNVHVLREPDVLARTLCSIDTLLDGHHKRPECSDLSKKIPNVGVFFTPLPFKEAFTIYDRKYNVSKRRHVPPSFNEVRHVFNIAQGIALTDTLRLLSFDGDETLYPDGENFEDMEMAAYIVKLIQMGVKIAIVTAACYGDQAERYEGRINELLLYMKESNLTEEQMGSFFLVGGESNYLLRCTPKAHLECIPSSKWPSTMRQEDASEVKKLLDAAERAIDEMVSELGLRATIIRKDTAVGLVPGGEEGRKRAPSGSGGRSLKFEILEEAVQRIRHAITGTGCNLPYCAFNGGRDVWVDIGNKEEGLKSLQNYLGLSPHTCAHIGDQFSPSGNDIAARNASPTFWISNPLETKAVMRSLLRQMGAHVEPNGDPPSPKSDTGVKRRDSRFEPTRTPVASWRVEEQEWLDSPGGVTTTTEDG